MQTMYESNNITVEWQPQEKIQEYDRAGNRNF